MISSVIARFSANYGEKQKLIDHIQSRPGLEVGGLVDQTSLPITIDARDNMEMEETTRWLQDLNGVEVVDVVFVHFES